MTTSTINEDAFVGDDGKSVEQIMHEVEEFGRSLRQGDDSVPHEKRPDGSGTLLETYEWRLYSGQPGTMPFVRAWCIADAAWMSLVMRTDPRYGPTVRKGVRYNGHPVQAWSCGTCSQWTVK